MPVFEAVVSKQKAMILSLTPASSTLLQDHCSHVSASRIRACRDPKKELGVIFPCEGGRRCGPPYRQRGTGGVFRPNQAQTLSGISWFRSSTIFSAAALSPQFVLRWTVLFENRPYPQMSFPKELER
ncbi:hypothetical protein GWK47_018128 [Chionoecetes opilio]|uniref:Uncharacterized protein n=1 Tax=Chionoecetes opilio TaxID=41210 RepID=A0A8J4XRB5_CHIOP|nr:hypothetical protein GWK47_018128 [Chionoecetes opilio]